MRKEMLRATFAMNIVLLNIRVYSNCSQGKLLAVPGNQFGTSQVESSVSLICHDTNDLPYWLLDQHSRFINNEAQDQAA
jgi:hypothetical protein